MAAKNWSWKQGDALDGLPRSLRPHAALIASMHTEDDGCFEDARGRRLTGIWVYLVNGLQFVDSECGTAHEPNVKTIAAMFDRVRVSEEVERVVESLLSLDRGTLAVLADMAEENAPAGVLPRPVAAWEDAVDARTAQEYGVRFLRSPSESQYADEFRYVKAFDVGGALMGARRLDDREPIVVYDQHARVVWSTGAAPMPTFVGGAA